MKYLTFLDYPTVESVGADFESKLQERDKEIDQLKNGMEELKFLFIYSDDGKDSIDCGEGQDEVWINESVDDDKATNCETVHSDSAS